MSAPRVFLLEDDPSVVRLVRPAIEGAGWTFVGAERAAGALDAMRAAPPDLALLDVELPDGNGFAVCEGMRADPLLRRVPAIFLTAHGDADSRLKGFAAGGQDYVAKPFAVPELLARARAHLNIKTESDLLRLANERLLTAERLRRDVNDMIVHDLRSPLSAIKGTIQILQDGGGLTREQHERLLSNAEAAVETTLLMINDLLDLGAGRLEVRPGPLELRPMTERLRSVLGALFERRRLALVVELEGADRRPLSDPNLVFRALANLLGNAAKFSPNDETVVLRASARPDGARFSVEDRGAGVPDAQKEAVFEKYHRVDPLAPTSGNGIGLAFCRMAADALGGKVWVEDAAPRGSRFVLEVPALGSGGIEPIAPEILKAYAEDCRSQLADARARVPGLEGAARAEALAALTTVAHRLAGSAGMYGFSGASQAARAFESELKAAADGKPYASAEAAARVAELVRRLGLA